MRGEEETKACKAKTTKPPIVECDYNCECRRCVFWAFWWAVLCQGCTKHWRVSGWQTMGREIMDSEPQQSRILVDRPVQLTPGQLRAWAFSKGKEGRAFNISPTLWCRIIIIIIINTPVCCIAGSDIAVQPLANTVYGFRPPTHLCCESG